MCINAFQCRENPALSANGMQFFPKRNPHIEAMVYHQNQLLEFERTQKETKTTEALENEFYQDKEAMTFVARHKNGIQTELINFWNGLGYSYRGNIDHIIEFVRTEADHFVPTVHKDFSLLDETLETDADTVLQIYFLGSTHI